MKKILFTGGHHNSALSVARALKEKKVGEIIWYGHRFSMQGDKSESAEYKEVTHSDIFFRELKAGKIYKTLNPLQLFRVPFGFFQAYWFLLKDQPDIVISFGGYLAAPVVLAAWLMGIPVVTHEQTTVAGLSNKFIAYFADKIFITWPQSKRYFPTEKVVLTGLPLRPALFTNNDGEPFFKNGLPLIYVTGGKQGSHIMNLAFAEALPKLLTKVNIIHQCGSNSIHNDYDVLLQKKNALPEELQTRYRLEKYVYEEEIGKVFSQATVVVSRAGAHTIYELAALGKPSILIPIPWASHNEQYKNARVLVNEGLSLLLPEDQLTAATLTDTIFKMFDSLPSYESQADQARSRVIFDATERMVEEITALIHEEAPNA